MADCFMIRADYILVIERGGNTHQSLRCDYFDLGKNDNRNAVCTLCTSTVGFHNIIHFKQRVKSKTIGISTDILYLNGTSLVVGIPTEPSKFQMFSANKCKIHNIIHFL